MQSLSFLKNGLITLFLDSKGSTDFRVAIRDLIISKHRATAAATKPTSNRMYAPEKLASVNGSLLELALCLLLNKAAVKSRSGPYFLSLYK